MQLSEAIRLGSLLRPQGKGHLWENGFSCALGAACDALGLTNEVQLRARYPALLRHAPCPVCTRLMGTFMLETTITHLNDQHGWTREAIADYIDRLTPPEVPDAHSLADATIA